MVKLRSFDAFPKVEESYVTQTESQKPMTYVFLFLSIFFLYLETSQWTGSGTKYQFGVDNKISETFQINLEIVVQADCNQVGVYIQDESQDRLFVNELVKGIRTRPTPEADDTWCTIGGIFDTNRVKGQLVIAPSNPMSAEPFNSSHFIRELSFGEFYPNMPNPLDMVYKEFQAPTVAVYYLSIVPTTYRALGMTLDTNQYTVTEAETSVPAGYAPGIIFTYDFDPINVTIMDNRLGFFAWLCRAVNIVGGVLFAIKGIQRFTKSKRGLASERTATGLLDHPKNN